MSLVQSIFKLKVSVQERKRLDQPSGEGVWFQHAGIPGWVSSLSFESETVGIADTVKSLTDFLNGLSPVPAYNDAGNQEFANLFKVDFEKSMELANISIPTLIKQALNQTVGLMVVTAPHTKVEVQLSLDGFVYFSDSLFSADVRNTTQTFVDSDTPASLSEILDTLREYRLPIHDLVVELEKEPTAGKMITSHERDELVMDLSWL